MIWTFLALVFSAGVLASPAWAGEEGGLARQDFIYHSALLKDMGPALQPEVHLGPAIDLRRAYLLDIGEEEFSERQQRPVRNLWDRIRNGSALPPLKGPLVAERERWYRQHKDLVAAISQKARRYLFHIVESVERRGLPMELALLPMVESGFEPTALSTAQAAGLWQFIPRTARRYRLKRTDHYDGRLDIVASTEAALDYLEFLYGMFKDWHLALAAYNWGEEAVMGAVLRNQARGLPADYESLGLPEETRNYVPKLIAIRNIVLSPESYGMQIADISNMPYFAEIDVHVPLDMRSVARLAGLPVEEVLALNPAYKSSFISGTGKPSVLLPVDRIEVFAQKIVNYPMKPRDVRKSVERKGVPKPVFSLKLPEERRL